MWVWLAEAHNRLWWLGRMAFKQKTFITLMTAIVPCINTLVFLPYYLQSVFTTPSGDSRLHDRSCEN